LSNVPQSASLFFALRLFDQATAFRRLVLAMLRAIHGTDPRQGFCLSSKETLEAALNSMAMTAADIAAGILTAEGIEATKADVQSVALGIQHSLKNHEGKGVEIVGEARPTRWRLIDR
jgi:hypothetical protein